MISYNEIIINRSCIIVDAFFSRKQMRNWKETNVQSIVIVDRRQIDREIDNPEKNW